MLITPEHPDLEKIVVFLNGRPLRSFNAANDEEGWVEVVDIKKMAPIDLYNNSIDSDSPEPWEELPIKRVHGKVEIRFIK
jgi:hypothetical protein